MKYGWHLSRYEKKKRKKSRITAGPNIISIVDTCSKLEALRRSPLHHKRQHQLLRVPGIYFSFFFNTVNRFLLFCDEFRSGNIFLWCFAGYRSAYVIFLLLLFFGISPQKDLHASCCDPFPPRSWSIKSIKYNKKTVSMTWLISMIGC